MNKLPFPRWMIIGLSLVFLLLSIGGYWFLESQRRDMRRVAENDLTAIAQLKSSQITDWRINQLAEANELMDSRFLAEGVAAWLDSRDQESRNRILARMQSIYNHYKYDDVLLVDANGQVLLSISGSDTLLAPEDQPYLETSLTSQSAVLTNIHLGEPDGKPLICAIAPLIMDENGKSRVLGAFILQSNANGFLYPLIQSWPLPSDSAESLLVRRVGEDVLFLNELRHQSGTALALRIPLTETDVPAVKAVLGEVGVFQGRDYRGVDVISAILPIPDSPWYLVAKVDTAEALAAFQTNAFYIILAILGLTASILITAALLWQRGASEHYYQLAQAQAAQNESEARFKELFETMAQGVVYQSADGHIMDANPAAESILGKSLDQMRSLTSSDPRWQAAREDGSPFPGEDHPSSVALRTGEEVHDVIMRIYNPVADGFKWIAIHAKPQFREDETTPYQVYTTFEDITNLKQTEIALQESEERHRVTLMSVGDGVIVTDKMGIIALMNPVAEVLTGCTAIEALDKPLDQVFHIINEKTRRKAANPLDKIFKHGLVVGLANHTILVCKDGSERPIADSGAPIRNDRGDIIGMVLVFRDQSDERAVQQALVESEAYLKNILDNLPIGVAVNSADPEVNFTYVNRIFAKIYRTTKKALFGVDTFWEAAYEDPVIREKLKQRVLEDIASVDPARMHWDDIPLTRKGEPTTYISAMNIPLPGSNQMVSTVWDTTNRVEAEDAIRKMNTELEKRVEQRTRQLKDAHQKLLRQERLAALGQLSGSISHELRNPLGVISNAVYVLGMLLPDANAKTKDYLDMISDETRRAESIITDLLDYSRVKSASRVKMNILTLANETLQRYPAPDHTKINLGVPDDLPPAFADAAQMTQVLGNLLLNAYQAMPDGGEVAIAAKVINRKKKQMIALLVSDTGSGIQPEHMASLFEPLFTTKPRGIGLGLPICMNLVKANGGWIEVNSKWGKGSTFTIFLPVLKEQL